MRLNKFLVLTIVAILLSAPVYAATCGDNNAQGNEECDGTDLRGYDCDELCHFNQNNPNDYDSQDTSTYSGFICGSGGSLSCSNTCEFISTCHPLICGDGIHEGNEACDNGDMNSDTVPDACRSDCTNPSCGDGVMDSNEECDDGNQNDDEIPDACRTNCLNAYCGDGVVDPYYEECDNGVNDGSQGCYQCMRCYLPSDDLHIREDAKLCEGTYTIADEGSEGVIVVSEDGNAESVTLNCNDAKLIGVDVEMAQMGQVNMNNDMMSTQFNNQNSEPNTQSMQSNIQSMEMTDQEANQESTGFMAQLFGFVMQIFTDDEEEEENTPPNTPDNTVSTTKVGTGIYATGNVVLVDCDVTNYAIGIKTTNTDNIVVDSKSCGNTRDIDGNNNYGVKNMCNQVMDWEENGIVGCTFDCNGDSQETEECPECVCEEYPECETEEVVEEEPVETPEEVVEEETPEEEQPTEVVVEQEPTEENVTEEEIIEDEVPEEEEPEDTTEDTVPEDYDADEDCIKEYTKDDYSEEEAKKLCYDEEQKEDEVIEDEKSTEEDTTENVEEDECIKKYTEEGYTDDEAKEKCYPEETTEEVIEDEKPTEEETTTDEEELTEEEKCMEEYIAKGYSEEEAKKYCYDEETDESKEFRYSAVTGNSILTTYKKVE